MAARNRKRGAAIALGTLSLFRGFHSAPAFAQALRRILFWSHLVAGLVAGSIVLIMSVTGLLLTYQKQMASWADTREFRITPSAARLSPDALIASARAAGGGTAASQLTMWSDPARPAAVALGQKTIYVDPYTGQVLGESRAQPRAFFRKVTDWHRWLGATPEGRARGRMITGACNLAFLFLVLSGLYLWLPRVWSWRQVRAVAWFRGGLTGKARDFNWHNAIGLWSAIPLAIVVASGAVISYPWASDLVYRLAGDTPPTRPAAQAQPGNRNTGSAAATPSLDLAWPRATEQVAGWRSISIRIPAAGAETATFTIDRGSAGQPQKRATLTVATRTGAVVKWEPFSSLSPGRRLRSYLRFAHTGEVWGLPGQTIAGVASLGGAFLVWTGLSLAIRRLWAWRTRTRRGASDRGSSAVAA